MYKGFIFPLPHDEAQPKMLPKVPQVQKPSFSHRLIPEIVSEHVKIIVQMILFLDQKTRNEIVV